jgi:hypothetical protein
VPLYRPADLPHTVLHVPLEDLASAGRKISADDLKARVRTALHEAAHLVAAWHCDAYIYGVMINSPARADRTGEYGGVDCIEKTDDDAAFISLVGYAWEQLHGDVKGAQTDLNWARRLAEDVDLPFDDLLHEAQKFVLEAEELIRFVAAGILAIVPKSGAIRGRTLNGLRRQLLPRLSPGLARGQVNATKLQQRAQQGGPTNRV